jgi:hypothetical protein
MKIQKDKKGPRFLRQLTLVQGSSRPVEMGMREERKCILWSAREVGLIKKYHICFY